MKGLELTNRYDIVGRKLKESSGILARNRRGRRDCRQEEILFFLFFWSNDRFVRLDVRLES